MEFTNHLCHLLLTDCSLNDALSSIKITMRRIGQEDNLEYTEWCVCSDGGLKVLIQHSYEETGTPGQNMYIRIASN
jgi:hypothetical protein